MGTVASRYRLVYWDSVKRDSRPVATGCAMGWLRDWLVDPEHRAEVVETYALLCAGARPSKGGMDERDLNQFVRPRIERALRTGELVLVDRAPKAGPLPALSEEPRKEATAGTAAASSGGSPKPTKTWVEFLVTDMAGEPVADVKYEAKLADGTKKDGKTDAKGLVRFDEIEPGLCEFKLVEYDGDTWKASSEPAVGTDFLEFELVDENEAGVPEQGWELKLADGKKQTGNTDVDGHVRLESLKPGQVELTFADLDAGSWKKL